MGFERRQLRLFLPLGIGVSLSLLGDQTLYAVLPTQADAIGIGLGAVGVLLSANRVVRIPGNPIAGLLYDRFGRRYLFLLGLLLGALSTAALGFRPALLICAAGTTGGLIVAFLALPETRPAPPADRSHPPIAAGPLSPKGLVAVLRQVD